jgi:RHS repeat-associated protein
MKEESALGGIYDFNARFYDPAIGRFLSADSIVPGAGNPQAFNRYSFVLNRPLNLVDPSG